MNKEVRDERGAGTPRQRWEGGVMRTRSEQEIGSPPLSEGKAGTSTKTLALSQQEMALLAGTSPGIFLRVLSLVGV